MKLTVATPTAVVLQRPDVAGVRAEDESGCFGVLPGHADFLTVLSISVLRWREHDGSEHYCALRRGVLTVSGGQDVTVSTREGIVSEDLDHLEDDVLTRFRQVAEAEQSARIESARLQTAAIRRIIQYLRPGQTSRWKAPP
jgi:F-type H+-transporting ATPase subunit epsilon